MKVFVFPSQHIATVAFFAFVGGFIPDVVEARSLALLYTKNVNFSSPPEQPKEGGFSRERTLYGNKNNAVFASLPVTFGYQGPVTSYRQETIQKTSTPARASVAGLAVAPVKITKDTKNPNSIRIPLSQAPTISQKTRKLNGRIVCEHKKDKPRKSKENNDGTHIDRECCLDPDEVPNPRCYYPQLGDKNSPDRNGR